MKRQLITSVFVLLLIATFIPLAQAKEGEKKVKSTIKEVTVFLSGAQITNTVSTSLGAGTTELVFTDLSPYILDNNIQAKGEGSFTILSVVKRINYLNAEDDQPKEVKDLQDSIESLNDKVQFQQGLWGIYDKEEQMLMANKDIGGQNTGVSINELEKAANLFRNRLTDIQTRKMESSNKTKKLQEKINKLNRQLTEMMSKQKQSTGEVVVSVAAKENTSARLSLSYIVSNAGWIPYYDIRAIDNKNPVNLEYRAKVWQNTGYDWDKVDLTLSTANPNQSGSKPILATWWINIYTPYVYKNTSSAGYGYTNVMPRAAEKSMSQDSRMEEAEPLPPAETMAQYTSMTEGQTNTSFEIKIPYSVPADGKQYSVEIQNYNVPATYKYYCAPKLDRDAFLLARITGWDQFNLMAGEANIFYEGMYVGKSYIDPRNVEDTLDISMGRDKNVIVTRIKLVDFCEKKVVGTTKKDAYVFEIAVRNKKKQDVEITIEDQVPVSQNSDITVEMTESSGAKYDTETGKLTWDLKLAPSDSKKIKLGFTVKYPKGKMVSNLN